MAPANEPQMHQQFVNCSLPNLDLMALLQPKQNSSLMNNFPHAASTADVAFLGLPTSDLNDLTRKQQSAVGEFSELLPPHPTEKPCVLPQGFRPVTLMDPSCNPQKRYLIFDQCGSHTRFFFSPSFSPQNQIIASRDPASHSGIYEEVATATQLDENFLVKKVVKETWDENHLMDGEGDMPEDSEEINALLYSYSDDDYGEDSDSDGENGEINSTGHTQCHNEGGGVDKNNLLENLTEDEANSGSSQKRQKLLDDGRYKKKPSFLSDGSPVEQANYCSYKDDVASSCPRNSSVRIDSIKREKQVKIRDALQILEGIIPGLNSKDPLHIIERAIVFLKSMRIEAEALGLSSYPKHDSASP